MNINGPFLIEGITYSFSELLETCRNLRLDPLLPAWKRDVYSFIELFLEPGSNLPRQNTSGTTGPAREFELNREAMILSARKTLDFFDLEPGNSALLCLPMKYIAGKMMVVRALVGRLDLVCEMPSGRPLKELDRKIDLAAMVPLQVHESIIQGDDLSRIEKLIIGGGEIHPILKVKLSHLITPHMYESFAMTETYTHFALMRINGNNPDPGFRVMEGVKIRTDERGCLVVDFAGVTTGEVVTNDLVEIDKGGEWFHWLGRYDNVINSGGIKLMPEVLEKQIGNLLGFNCLVVSEPDEKLGEKLVLIIELTDGKPEIESVMQKLRLHLSGHEVPKRVVVVKEIPRNSSFKPDRIKVRELL